MASETFSASAFIYGHEGARVEVDIVAPINPTSLSLSPKMLTPYAEDKIRGLMPDFKSSYALSCEFCGMEIRFFDTHCRLTRS